jgi:uncharacterized protein (TIGR02300 family)
MDLGKKYMCGKCGAKFYDLNRPTPVCPKCKTDQNTLPPPDKKKISFKEAKESKEKRFPVRGEEEEAPFVEPYEEEEEYEEEFEPGEDDLFDLDEEFNEEEE